jgi:hypothetical protein
MTYDYRLLWGILVGIGLSVLAHNLYTEIDKVIAENMCSGRTTSTAHWEGYISKKDGITYCFEKTMGYPHKAIYRGIVKVD